MAEPREPYRRSKTSDKDGMSLPAGKKCEDCIHFDRCEWLIGRIPRDEVCDWSPSRFGGKGVTNG